MTSIVQFIVNDTSPTVIYQPPLSVSPPFETFETGWVPCFTDIGCAPFFTQGTISNGTSYHETSRDNATMTVNWRGTSVQLMGNISNSSVNYTIILDGSATQPRPDLAQGILASFQGLRLQDHSISLVVHNPNSTSEDIVSFQGVRFTANDTEAGGGATSFNDTDVAFDGSWSLDNSQFGQYRHSFASGDAAKTSFQGASLMLYGVTGPSSGSYAIALNAAVVKNQTDHRYLTTGTFTAKTPFTNPNALLFYALDLDPTIPYSLIITNEGGGDLSIKTDGFQVFVPPNPPSPPSATPTRAPVSASQVSGISKSTIAAITLAAFLFSFAAALTFFYLFVFRPRARRCRAEVDALRASTLKSGGTGDPVMRLEEARESQGSSYRRRLARIISMINAPEPKRRSARKSQQQQPLTPLSRTSTHKSDYILDISRKAGDTQDVGQTDRVSIHGQPPSEEGETLFVHAPTAALGSGPQSPQDQPSEDNGRIRSLPGIFFHARRRSSPNVTIPVSPSISSAGRTHSHSQSSQASSRPRSNMFSVPFSLYARSRSHTENGEGDRSRSTANGPGAPVVDNRGPGEGTEESMSTMVFADVKAAQPPQQPPPGESGGREGIKEETGKGEGPVKARGIREGVGRVVRSFVSGLSGVGKQRQSRTAGEGGDVIYPFVGLSSSASTTRPRRLPNGGGLIVLDVGGPSSGARSSSAEASGIVGERERRGEVQRQSSSNQGTDRGTDITPLSYASESSGSVPTRGDGTEREEERNVDPDGSTTLPPSFPPSHPHPFAAAALASTIEDRSAFERSPVGPRISAPVPSARPPRRQTTAGTFRQLPTIPGSPHTAHSAPPQQTPPQAPIRPASDNLASVSIGTRGTRALPPLPTPPVAPQTVPSDLEPSGEASAAPLPQTSAAQEDRTSTLSPADQPIEASRGTEPLNEPENTLSDTSQKDSSTGQEGAAVHPIRPEGTQQPTMTPRTTRSIAHSSFLDFSSSSSSSGRDGSSRDKSEPRSPPSEFDQPGQNVQHPDERNTQEEDRRTFGQSSTERSSFYYSSLDMPLPSSETDSSHQTYQSYQSYQSQAQEGQRPSSWSHQRRRHASWRTFGGRIEGDIPEEVSPLESSGPSAPPEAEREDIPSESPTDQTPSSIQQSQPPPQPVPLQGTVTQDTDEPGRGEGRTSYMSTSSGGYAHVHPIPAGFDIQQPHPYTTHPSALQMSQIEPTSPSTDEASPSPIHFRTGGVRRTSEGDAQPVAYRRHRRHNDGSSSSGSGSDLRPQRHPRHPFGIP